MKCYRNSEEKILKSAASAQPSWRGGERPKKENRKLTACKRISKWPSPAGVKGSRREEQARPPGGKFLRRHGA